MTRVQDAIQRIYEDADLRDELTDDEADQMLGWAEDELSRLDASGADEAAFEAQVETLMRLLKRMNRFAGRQGQFSAQADDQATEKIAALADELGHPADAGQVAAAGTGDPATTLTALIGLLSVTPAASQAAVPAEAVEQADAPAGQAVESQKEFPGAPAFAAPTPEPMEFPSARFGAAQPARQFPPAPADQLDLSEQAPQPAVAPALPEVQPDQLDEAAVEPQSVPAQPPDDPPADDDDQAPADNATHTSFGAYIDEYDL